MMSENDFSVSFIADQTTLSGLFVLNGVGGEIQKNIRLKCAPPYAPPKFVKVPEDAKITSGIAVSIIV